MNPSRCPNCVNDECDAISVNQLVDGRERLARGVVKVDRAVLRYERKRAGKESFTDFAAMVPAAVREGQAA